MSCSSSGSGVQKADLLIPQGEDRTVQWPIVDGNNDPLPSMTGWTARAQARDRVTSTDTLYEWTTSEGAGPGSIVLADSALSLIFASEVTSEWTWAKAVYDVELVSDTGKVTRIAEGAIRIDPEVTR